MIEYRVQDMLLLLKKSKKKRYYYKTNSFHFDYLRES